jgi:hypothetical protein
MTDMLSLFDEVPARVADRRPERYLSPAGALNAFECCGRTFLSWPGFLGHLGASHPVVR